MKAPWLPEDRIEWVTQPTLKGCGWRTILRLAALPGRLELDLGQLHTYEVWAQWGDATSPNNEGYYKIWEGDDAQRLLRKVSFWAERTHVRIVKRHVDTPLDQALLRLEALALGWDRAQSKIFTRVDAGADECARRVRHARMTSRVDRAA